MLKESNVRQRPDSGHPEINDRSITTHHHRDDTYFPAFQSLFHIFKHQAPQLASLADVQALVDLTDKYDSPQVVSQAVRLHFMGSGGDPAQLYLQIAKEPITFLSISKKVWSSIIVKKAAAHILGTWSETATSCQDLVSDGLFKILVKASENLRRKQQRANKMLLSLN